VCTGTLNTLLHPDQAAYWVTALTPTGTPAVLPSYSLSYWDSVRGWQFVGCIIQSFTITASAQQDYTTLSINWIGQQATNPAVSAPAESNYSTLTPYAYVETAGNVKLAGSAITNYRNMSIKIDNKLTGTWDELSYITSLLYCGRDLDFTLGPQYLATAYRGDLEAQTPLTWILKFNRTSPAHSFTVTCETANYVANIGDDLPLDGAGYQNIDVQCFYDAANTTDFTLAAT
jgi:hypothetical protein